MKTTKKLFSFFLAVVLVFGAIPIVNTQAPFSILSFASERDITDSGNINSSIQWMLYSDGELVISGSGNMPDFPELPPWFAYRDMITSISVNEGITSIGGYAFLALYNTVSVTLPEGITSIGGSSFEKMLRLKKINIPSTVKSIDLYAFNSCLSLEEIILPEGLEKINCAFPYCASLKELTIPSTVKTFMPGELSGCYSLRKLVISEGTSFTIMDDNIYGLPSEATGYDKETADTIIIRELSEALDDLIFLEYLEIPSTINNDGIAEAKLPLLKELHNKSTNLAFKFTGDTYLTEYAKESAIITYKLDIIYSLYYLASSFLDNEINGEILFSDFSINEFLTELFGFDISLLENPNPDIEDILTVYSILLEKEIISYHEMVRMSMEMYYVSIYAYNTSVYCYDDSLQHRIIDKNDLSSYSRHILLDSNEECSEELILKQTYEATESGYDEDGNYIRGHGTFSYEVDVESRTLLLSGDGDMPQWSDNKQPGYANCSLLFDKIIFKAGSNIETITELSFVGLKTTEIHIPSSIEIIEDGAFFGCSDLSVYIAAGADAQGFAHAGSNFGIKEFIVAEDHQTYSSYDGALYFNSIKLDDLYNDDETVPVNPEDEGISDNTEVETVSDIFDPPEGYAGLALAAVPAEKTSIRISDETKIILPTAFYGLDIETISIPDSVEYNLAFFYFCPNLKTVNIGAGTKCYLSIAFIPVYCPSLTAFTVDENNEYYYADENGVLFSKDKTILIAYPGGKTQKTYTVPENVSVIATGAFFTNYNVASIILPQNVKSVQDQSLPEFIKAVTFLNPEAEIFDSPHTIPNSASIIYGYEGSTAQEYAEKYSRTFIALSDCVHTGGTATCESLAVCELCGKEYGSLGEHNEATYTENESCTVNGYTLTFCTVCGEDLDFKTIEAKHLWSEDYTVITPATCTQEGTEKRLCERCTEEETRTIPMTEHNYSDQFTEDIKPTCTENGSKSRHCKNCTAVTDITSIPATGHSFGEWHTIIEPTYTENGKKERLCILCNTTEYEEIPLIEIKEYKDEKSGVIILADKEAYNGKDISVTVEEVFDGSHYLGISYGNVESWNITTYIDGEEAQPSTPVYVKIPLPDNFNEKKCTVYHINSQTNQKEKIASDVIDGYICFYAESFSIYIVVDESSAIENPAENCDHICHKSGFLGFIWKIIVFFSKLFKINPVCDCGTAHY